MFELAVVLLLVLFNGALAGAEMAVVTARSARLEAMAEEGVRGARAVLRLREHPERFLAAVQVGITLVGALAGAFGGSAFAARVAPWIEELGAGEAAPQIAFVVVVALITYLTVVLGELVPKSLALRLGERAAVIAAPPMLLFAWIARPAVWFLTASSNAVLRAFGDHTDFMEARVTREDIEAMVREGRSEGSLDARTGTLLSRALEFTELNVADVMVHRRAVVAISRDASREQLESAVLQTGHRRIPVFEETIDHVVGYLLRDDLLAAAWKREPIELESVIREPLFVPEQMSAERALRDLQSRKEHLAIVVEETGGVAGIVTLEDLVEELVGEIFYELDHAAPDRLKKEAPRVWRVQGIVDLRELTREIGLVVPDGVRARTIGGLCTELAEDRIPAAGATFELEDGTRLEVVEATARRVRGVRIVRAP